MFRLSTRRRLHYSSNSRRYLLLFAQVCLLLRPSALLRMGMPYCKRTYMFACRTGSSRQGAPCSPRPSGAMVYGPQVSGLAWPSRLQSHLSLPSSRTRGRRPSHDPPVLLSFSYPNAIGIARLAAKHQHQKRSRRHPQARHGTQKSRGSALPRPTPPV